MKVFHLDRENTLSVSLFSDVTNSKELLNSILDGSPKLEVSFLNALLDTLQTTSLMMLLLFISCSKLDYILAARFNASPLEMEEVAKLIKGKEIDLEELKTHANQAHMLKCIDLPDLRHQLRRCKTLNYALLFRRRLRVMKIFHLDRENTLSVSFFSDVTNSKELLSSILDGTLKLEVSFLNALLITESLKRCGISESSTYILAARFNASPLETEEVAKLINGKEIDLEELKTHANQAHMLKHYKIT
ncbi:hypothetical protein F2Q68_00028884 [Brassica cretica]|uniref:Uncharacterized protein n=1 Tax=Brassica cretica TaxID=69181 RepID=A0A8S9GCX4_BRACR|nr:hypothetical protein F2Q68_00028884 [Brassica cretica]